VTSNSLTVKSSCGVEILGSTTLSGDITGCTNSYILNVTAANTVLDCNGQMVHSTGNFGIYVTADNVTIRNCEVRLNGSTSTRGIMVENADNVTIHNNTLNIDPTTQSNLNGIYLQQSHNGRIYNNTIYV